MFFLCLPQQERQQKEEFEFKSLKEGDIVAAMPPPNSIARLKQGTGIGEAALNAGDLASPVTLVAGSDFEVNSELSLSEQREGSFLLTIPRETFLEAVRPKNTGQISDIAEMVSFLRGIDVFSSMGERHLHQLAFNIIPIQVPPHDTLVKLNEPVDRIYIVKSGSLSILGKPIQDPDEAELKGKDRLKAAKSFQKKFRFRNRERKMALIGPGAVIGAKELVDRTGYQASVCTESTCELFWGHGHILEDILKSSFDLTATINHHHNLFESVNSHQKEMIQKTKTVGHLNANRGPLTASPKPLTLSPDVNP